MNRFLFKSINSLLTVLVSFSILMSHPTKRVRIDTAAVATAQYYNTTGTVPSSFQLSTDLSYLITTQPNCTIACYELPPECSEVEIQAAFARCGPTKNVQKVCGGRAALIEFNEISLPTRLVHWAKINPFYIGVYPVRLEFSSQAITAPAQPVTQTPVSSSDSAPSNILNLEITNAEYPITVDVLKSICSRHGNLHRIFIGKVNVDKSLEALVEYSMVEEAKQAKEHLDGADIYSGCCSLAVTFAKVKKVHVTKNDAESWDFTESNASKECLLNNVPSQRTLLGPAAQNATNGQLMPASTADPTVSSATSMPLVAATTATQAGPLPITYQQPYYGYPQGPQYMQPGSVPPGYYSSMPMHMPGYPSPAAPYGMQAPMPPYYQHPSGYQMYPTYAQQMPSQHATVRSVPQIIPTPAPVHHVTPAGIGIGHSTSNPSSSSISSARNTDMSIFFAEEGAVLMVCNLPEGVNCDHLFNVLCLYGNIARIKFLKSRPGCAMIQMGSKEGADHVHSHLDGANVFGQTIQFHYSKQTEVQEHAGLGTLSDGSPVMKNYMSDSNNRFRNPLVAAKSRILSPTRTLHFFNAPLNFTPEDMCRIFADCGVKRPPRIVVFTPKPAQKTSLGLAEWDSLAEALDALALSNHHPIHIVGFAHPFHLKLAFSPKPISDDRAGACMINYPAPPIPIVKETFLYRKAPSTTPTSAATISAPPHIIVTVASSTPTASVQSNQSQKDDNPALPQDDFGEEDSKRSTQKRKMSSQTFDVDELEAAEKNYLEQLVTGGVSDVENNTVCEKTASSLDDNNRHPSDFIDEPRIAHVRPTTPELEDGIEENVLCREENNSLSPEPGESDESSILSPPPRKVHQPPATPPSELDEDYD